MVLGLLVAVAVGGAIGVQATILGRAAVSVDALAVSWALLLSGTVIGGAWVSASRAWPSVLMVAGAWWWVPLGAVGWLVVAGLGFAASRAGAAPVLATSVAAQCVTAALLTGHAVFQWRTAIGVSLLVAGAAVVATSAQ